MRLFLSSIVFLFPLIALAGAGSPVQHKHGERAHSHPLPESGTNHSHGGKRQQTNRVIIKERQFSIEARIVSVSDTYIKELADRFGVTKVGSNGGLTPGSAGALGYSLLAKDYLLDLELSALQSENEGDIVSSPRVVTTNNKKTLIAQGVDIPYLHNAGNAEGISPKKTLLSLEVTPQATPDGHVILDLKITSVFSDASITNKREINTQVLVDDGQTVVVGVFERTNDNDQTKAYVSSDLPYLGKLFSKKSTSTKNRKLLIFVTPRMMN